MEDWLVRVEDTMFSSLRRIIKAAMADYEQREREDWVMQHCSQVVLTRDVQELRSNPFATGT